MIKSCIAIDVNHLFLANLWQLNDDEMNQKL